MNIRLQINIKQHIKIEPKSFFIAVFILISLFMVPFENSTTGIASTFFGSLDELGALLFFAWAFLYFFRDDDRIRNITVVYVLFLAWGIICSLQNSTQPLSAQLKDIICCAKYAMTLMGAYCVGYHNHHRYYIKQVLYYLARWISVILFVYVVYSLIRGEAVSGVSLLGSHPTNISHIAVGLSAIMFYASPDEEIPIRWILVDLIIALGSKTSKSYGIVVLIIALVFFKDYIESKWRYLMYLAIGIGVLLIGYSAIESYYINDDSSARALLATYAVTIISEKGLFGYGFAMYGSSQAAAVYSPLYIRFGFDKRHGMTPSNPKWLKDAFWPTVAGQFGVVGLVLFFIFLWLQLKVIMPIRKFSYKNYAAALILLGYLCIMSMGGTAFFNPIAVPYAIILGLIFSDPISRGEKASDESADK